MSDARTEILGRIRGAVHPTEVPIKRAYRISGSLEQSQLIDLFEDRLKDYGAAVYRCLPPEIGSTVAHALSNRTKRNLLTPPSVPEQWLPRDYAFRSAQNLSYRQLDEAEGVLTGCSVAIAETGTIILQHSQQAGTRAATLIPDYHLCVVQAHQIVEAVPEGLARCRGFATAPITTISGPSATSDIQMMRVKGVHGPRVLDVIIAC